MSITDDCLSSIYSSHWHSPFEVIVVDNNSNDGSVEMIKNKYPQVRLIENKTNNLFAKANNQGAEIARGRYLLLLNSDTLVNGDNLQRMVDYFDSLSDDVICIGPRILNKDGSIQSTGFPNPGLRERFWMCSHLYRFFERPNFILKGLPGDYNRRVGWIAGCAMMIKSDLYKKVGGLNERVEFYGEEPEFGYRTSKAGYITLYWNGAELIHLGGISTKKQKPKTTAEQEETRLRRYSKLQKETVGYGRAIWMSYIVLFFAYIKRAVSKDKDYYSDAINWEKKVVNYLKICKRENR